MGPAQGRISCFGAIREGDVMIYLITYDLNTPGKDYSGLHAVIKRLGPWWHYLDSTWLVSTELDAMGIWNQIGNKIDENDRMLIIKATRDYAGWLTSEAWDWINNAI
jgi:hypothetical protein